MKISKSVVLTPEQVYEAITAYLGREEIIIPETAAIRFLKSQKYTPFDKVIVEWETSKE